MSATRADTTLTAARKRANDAPLGNTTNLDAVPAAPAVLAPTPTSRPGPARSKPAQRVKALEKENVHLFEQNATLTEELETARQQLAVAQAEVMQLKQQAPPSPRKVIAVPPRMRKTKAHPEPVPALVEMMELEDDKDKYNELMTKVRIIVQRKLNIQLGWKQQSTNDIARFHKAIASEVPDMGDYENNWAAHTMAVRYLGNRKHYARKMHRESPVPASHRVATRSLSRSPARYDNDIHLDGDAGGSDAD